MKTRNRFRTRTRRRMNRQISIRTIINKTAITKNSRRTSRGEAGREGYRDVYIKCTLTGEP